MRNLMLITRPMGAADITIAAEDAGKLALALSDLARGIYAYEAATGAAIAVVDADHGAPHASEYASGSLQGTADGDTGYFGYGDSQASKCGSDMPSSASEAYAKMQQPVWAATIPAESEPPTADAELLDAMYPKPVPEARTVPQDIEAGDEDEAMRGAFRCGKTQESAPPRSVQKMPNSQPVWQGKIIPADLRDAVQHIANLGASGPKWGFNQDLDLIERAIDGHGEKLIADVMEFSQSHIRQRFNKLVDRTHGHGNRFAREQIRDALQWMTEWDEMSTL